MIQRQSHVSIYVLNQEESLAFYRDKLGFEVRTDVKMDNGFRWLTVGPKAQPDLELVLMEPNEMCCGSRENAARLRDMIKQGSFGVGVFETDDCRGTYKELKAKGVTFKGEPEERFYGIETVVQDNSGNWFSLVQRPKR
jgi:catechol 2,3-dioxygenase-like lactoylglutathione lyase family enzyme